MVNMHAIDVQSILKMDITEAIMAFNVSMIRPISTDIFVLNARGSTCIVFLIQTVYLVQTVSPFPSFERIRVCPLPTQGVANERRRHCKMSTQQINYEQHLHVPYTSTHSVTCSHIIAPALFDCTNINYRYGHLFAPRWDDHLCFRRSLLSHHKGLSCTRAFAEQTTRIQKAAEQLVRSMVQCSSRSHRRLLSSHPWDDLRRVRSSPIVLYEDLPYGN